MDEPIFTSLWPNGARIDIYYHDQKVEGEDESDRIQLIITPENSKPRGWLMNVTDANMIIYGLSKGIDKCLQNNIPVKPEGGDVHDC